MEERARNLHLRPDPVTNAFSHLQEARRERELAPTAENMARIEALPHPAAWPPEDVFPALPQPTGPAPGVWQGRSLYLLYKSLESRRQREAARVQAEAGRFMAALMLADRAGRAKAKAARSWLS